MAVRNFIIQSYAKKISKDIKKMSENALEDQERIFKSLLHQASECRFAKHHHFKNICNHNDYCEAVPIAEYEDIKHYIEAIIDGEKNVLWN